MSSIIFDFSSIYENRNTYTLRNSTFLKYLDEQGLDFEEYLRDVFAMYKDFYVSCASLNRKSIKVDEEEIFKNYFFRPVSDEKRNIMLRGDIKISPSVAYFKVEDIYMIDSISKRNYESKININVSVRIENKNMKGDVVPLRNIISSTPVVGKEEGISFVDRWDSYLEFERKFFLDQMGYYKTLDFRIIDLVEVKRSVDNYSKYQDVIYYDDGSSYMYLYKEEAGYIENASYVECIEFEVELESDELRNKLSSFISNEIEIAAPMEALDENGKLRFGINNLEFMFRTKRLGGILKPLSYIANEDDKHLYSFSKFWIDDVDLSFQGSERVEEYIRTFFSSTPLLVNVLSGDLALYKRGKQALKDIREGNVKNPALINYLMNIDVEEESVNVIKEEDVVWSNQYLDSYQKKAILEALSSNSIFLIQGPPGTGKTQVISELVYQLNKANNKVLLSSQTHVAIDNALERLPNELDILPIRLINQERRVKFAEDYLPDRLVDNLYSRIKKRYSDNIYNFNVYSDNILKYRKEFESIVSLHKDKHKILDEYDSLIKSRNNCNQRLNEIDNKLMNNQVDLLNYINIIKFIDDHIESSLEIKDYGYKIPMFIEGIKDVFDKHMKDFVIDVDDMNEYFKYLSSSKSFIEEYKSVVNKDLLNKKKSNINKNIALINEMDIDLNKEKGKLFNEIEIITKKINSVYKSNKVEIDLINKYYDSYIEEDANSVPLTREEKLEYIESIILRKENQFLLDKERIEKYKDIYLDCIKFIEEKEDMDYDRIEHSKYLLDNNANVYGITCNANSKYLEEKNDYLSILGLGNIDLKNIDFDVTIIDEVSKATPVELLIPILYSKSIILVGDHRQLPPTFKYKENMLEYLSEENKISATKLKEYQSMVEDSLFAHLFSSLKKNKSMLINQYRSHSQIVDIINTFYEGRLNVGNLETQDEAKQHYLETKSNDLELFTPNIHTYWFNSHYGVDGEVSYEKKLMKGSGVSTSFYNEEEIYLIEKILKNMDEGYSNFDKESIPSIGIISLYGDQVREIKKKISKMKFENIDMNSSRVYTVDEFQGKEEDIIIVSLVRNNKSFNAGEFTKKYERINVALSRARKMLVVVGSKEFFSSLDVTIPSLNDDSKKIKRKLYKEIYDKVIGKIDNPNKYFK